jgi:hypothetical protein
LANKTIDGIKIVNPTDFVIEMEMEKKYAGKKHREGAQH